MLYMLSDMHHMLNNSTQGELHKHVFSLTPQWHTHAVHVQQMVQFANTAGQASCIQTRVWWLWQVHAAPFS